MGVHQQFRATLMLFVLSICSAMDGPPIQRTLSHGGNGWSSHGEEIEVEQDVATIPPPSPMRRTLTRFEPSHSEEIEVEQDVATMSAPATPPVDEETRRVSEYMATLMHEIKEGKGLSFRAYVFHEPRQSSPVRTEEIQDVATMSAPATPPMDEETRRVSEYMTTLMNIARDEGRKPSFRAYGFREPRQSEETEEIQSPATSTNLADVDEISEFDYLEDAEDIDEVVFHLLQAAKHTDFRCNMKHLFHAMAEKSRRDHRQGAITERAQLHNNLNTLLNMNSRYA